MTIVLSTVIRKQNRVFWKGRQYRTRKIRETKKQTGLLQVQTKNGIVT